MKKLKKLLVQECSNEGEGTIKNFLKTVCLLKEQCNELHDCKDISEKQKIELFDLFNRLIKQMAEIESFLNIKSSELIRISFRECIGVQIYQSQLLERFYKKPRGYPGDYLMFEQIYDNKSISDCFGSLLDEYILSYSLAKSMLNRKSIMQDLLLEYVTKTPKKKIKIANIGSGGGREIREIINSFPKTKEIEFLFIDQDLEALNYAELNLVLPKNISFRYIQANAEEIIGFKDFSRLDEQEKFDIVYSLGLIDYFHDNVLLKFIKYWLLHVNTGGRLVIASCSSNNLYMYSLLTWFAEWHFIKRNKNKTIGFLKKSFTSDKLFQTLNSIDEKLNNVFFLDFYV